MKTSTLILGRKGESLAAEFLQHNNHTIIDTNWRRGRHEADIVAYREGMLVFVEVKTRNSTAYGEPEEFVTLDKQRGYIRLANAYVMEHNREEEVRFDVIAIVMNSTGYRLQHFENAFSAVSLYL